MKRTAVLAVLVFVAGLAAGVGLSAFAAPRTYQVTGPVVETRSDAIVVKKGTDNWEIARDSGTKVTGTVAVGAKVTVMYRMTAASIEVKAATPAAKKK